MKTLNVNQPVGSIVAMMPKASEVFKKYGIDFCCGGNKPLLEVIKEQNLDAHEVMGKLEEALEETKKVTNHTDFTGMTASALIDYIERTHHVYVKSILPELSELSTTILRVHGPSHKNLFKVHKLFHSLKMELDQHLIKEEAILFPLIKEYSSHPSKVSLDRIHEVMKETEDEHETAGGVLKELRLVTENYKIPKDVCGTFVLTYDKLQELESDLFEHIHLENNILFKGFA